MDTRAKIWTHVRKNGHACKFLDTRAKKWTRVQKYGHTCKKWTRVQKYGLTRKKMDTREKKWTQVQKCGHACKNIETRANIRTQTKYGHEFYKLTQRYRHLRNYTCWKQGLTLIKTSLKPS